MKRRKTINILQELGESTNETKSEDLIQLSLNLPHVGESGEKIVNKLTKLIKKKVNHGKERISVTTIYKSSKLNSKFVLKDKTKFEHMHNVVYHAKCPNKKCNSHYAGQTKCQIQKRALQHRNTDRNSHLYKHAESTKHKKVYLRDFKILGQRYSSDFKRKISESLYIKQDLNIQKDSYKLSRFN